MLAELLYRRFFSRPIPRCAWRLDFGADYADAILEKFADRKPQDIIRTLTRFSAAAIVRSLEENVPALGSLDTLISSGGGVRNGTLLQQIQDLQEIQDLLPQAPDSAAVG